ncbi:RipA family octameric membrane protein [Parabacteroides sp.]
MDNNGSKLKLEIKGTSKSKQKIKEKKTQRKKTGKSGSASNSEKLTEQKKRDVIRSARHNTRVFARGKMPVEMYMNADLTSKDIYMNWWRCRDFELSYLWQRSIFLSGLLVLCFTGYGVLVLRMLDGLKAGYDSHDLQIINNLAVIVCVLGFMFSTFWIMMAKGSKAWHEKIEMAIDNYENNYSLPVHSFTTEKIGMDESFCTTSPGPYSPSRINIGIGILSMWIWIIAIVVHALLIIHEFEVCENFLCIISWIISVGAIVVCVMLVCCKKYCSCFKSDPLLKSKN